MLFNQTDRIKEQLEHVLEKDSAYRLRITRGQKTGLERKWRQVYVKNYCILPLPIEIKTYHEEPSSTAKCIRRSYSFSVDMLFCKLTPNA